MEIIDRDWYRGETKGGAARGIFPASFVRVVDAFPGDAPSASANVRPYLEAGKHKGNEYMNTANQFRGLEEAMRAMGQQGGNSIDILARFPNLSLIMYLEF